MVAIQGSELMVDTGRGKQKVLMAPDVEIDEGTWTTQLPIQVGDQVFMVGEPRDTEWEAKKIWINAVNVAGYVAAIEHLLSKGVQFWLQLDRPLFEKKRVQGWIPEFFIIQQREDEVTARLWKGRMFTFKVGMHVRVVGRMYQGRLYVINMFRE